MKKFFAIITIIITLFAFSINTFALTMTPNDVTSARAEFQSWDGIADMNIHFDGYNVDLDITTAANAGTEDSTFIQQEINTDTVIFNQQMQLIEMPRRPEGDTQTIDLPVFWTGYFGENTRFNKILLEYQGNAYPRITYVSISGLTEENVVVFEGISYNFPANIRNIYFGEDVAYDVSTDSALADYVWLYNNCQAWSFKTDRRRYYNGSYTFSESGDIGKLSQTWTIRKSNMSGKGWPVVLGFEAKNVVLYPQDIPYTTTMWDDSILPRIMLPGDNTNTALPLPDDYIEGGATARAYVSYTYFLRETRPNGETVINQYKGSKTVYNNAIKDQEMAFLIPPPSVIFSEEIYNKIEGIIYDEVITTFWMSRAINDIDITIYTTLMKGETYDNYTITSFIQNVRFYPSESLRFSDLATFLSNIGDGFFNTKIFGLFAISDILFIIIAIGAVVVFLKLFAGG